MADNHRNEAPVLSAVHAALAAATFDVERHESSTGWDLPSKLLALVPTRDLLAQDPRFGDLIDPATLEQAEKDEHHLTAIEQEEAHTPEDLEKLLGTLLWPEEVQGCVVVLERLIVAPRAVSQVSAGLDRATEADVEALYAHPEGRLARLVVALDRAGNSWCVVRLRETGEPRSGDLSAGPALTPGLLESIAATFED